MMEVELWGILNRLNIFLDKNFEKILIQTDSIEAVNVIQNDSQTLTLL